MPLGMKVPSVNITANASLEIQNRNLNMRCFNVEETVKIDSLSSQTFMGGYKNKGTGQGRKIPQAYWDCVKNNGHSKKVSEQHFRNKTVISAQIQ